MPGPADAARPGAGRGGFAVAGTGTAASATPAEFARNAPSFFADPVAWLIAAAVDRALDDCPDDLTHRPDQVGVIALSALCSGLTMAALAASAGRGMVSPLRFAGANPGVLAGLPCIRRQFRGPTLTLAMPPAHGLEPAAVAAGAWLDGGQATHVLIATHLVEDGVHVARCAVLRAAPHAPDAPDGRRELDRLLGPDVSE
ncbi:polyketide synthase [Kitasatospora sp. NBC_01560]|uniref:polyketide synthase n=1 Tax=Kitasatospora sp. NBC_01560 TaxID=2975965 RepID=UPI0038704AB3